MRWALGFVARHPGLWPEAVRAWVASSPDRWWATFPFVPRADPEYVAWRMATAYGTAAAPMRGEDLAGYLTWRKKQRSAG